MGWLPRRRLLDEWEPGFKLSDPVQYFPVFAQSFLFNKRCSPLGEAASSSVRLGKLKYSISRLVIGKCLALAVALELPSSPRAKYVC